MSHTEPISRFPSPLKYPRQMPIYTLQVRPNLNFETATDGMRWKQDVSADAIFIPFLFTDDRKRMEERRLIDN